MQRLRKDLTQTQQKSLQLARLSGIHAAHQKETNGAY